MKNYIYFKLYEKDIIYLLNCIMLSKKILQDGNPDVFSHYFKKSDYFTYIYDLTSLQKVISYQANREMYNYVDNDFFVGHQYWLNHKEKNFDFLKGKDRINMLNNIKNEIRQIKQIEENKILRQEVLKSLDLGIFKKKFSRKFIFFNKVLDKRKVV